MTPDIIEATLKFRDLDAQVEVLEYRGREAIGELFAFELTVAAREPLDVDRLIAGSATLSFSVEGVRMRAIEGVIAQCVDLLSAETDADLYRLRLVPTWWRATLVELIDVFMDMDLPTLVQHKLGLIDMHPAADFVLRLQDPYPVHEFVVQYQESDFHFVARLLEHLGLSFFFEHHEDREVLVVADHNGAFSRIGDGSPIPFHARGETAGVFELTQATDVIPAHYIQRDYNYRQPDVDLLADVAVTGPGRAGGHYEYGGHFKSIEEAQRIARIRAEERACRQKLIEGRSELPILRAGGRTTISGHRRGDLELIVTAVEHRGSQGFYAKDGPRYENRFEAVTPEETFRPRRVTPRPRITGMLTGIVESASDSDYADVDDQGRYRVRFLFDTNAPGERQASRPIRMMQPHAGHGYGMHFPLRGGVEVLVAFVGGDPDRPIIAGTVPNPQTPSPVVQGNRERNVIRTGAGNEINIDDTDGEERIKLSTPKHGATLQLGSPNSPESGVVAESTASVTSAATGTVNQLGALSNSWSLWNNLWGNHVTAIAGKVLPLQVATYTWDVVRGTYAQLSGHFDTIMAAHDTHVHFKQVEADAAEKRLSDQTPPGAESPEAALADMRSTLDDKTDALIQGLNADFDNYNLAVGDRKDDDGNPLFSDGSKQAALGVLTGNDQGFVAANDEEREKIIDLLEAEYEAVQTTDPQRAALIQHHLVQLEEKRLSDEKAKAAKQKEELAALHRELAAIEADDSLGVAEKQQAIETQLDAIEAKGDAIDDAKENAQEIEGQRDDRLAELDAALRDASDPNSNELREYDEAYLHWNAYNQTFREAQSAKEEVEDAKEGWDDAKSYKDTVDTVFNGLDSIASVPYSILLSFYGTGMQGYAQKCTNIMVDEARAQRIGSAREVLEIASKAGGWPDPPLPSDFGRSAAAKPGKPRTNAGWGAVSRIRWLYANKDYDAVKLETGGGGAFKGVYGTKAKLVLFGLLSAALGPVAGPIFHKLLNQSGAFKESRNIQGSEQKAVLFGKQSVLVNGQEHTTVASGGKLLLTSNDEAVFHTRGKAEVVGVESAYLASAKKVDLLSRGTIQLDVTDRSGHGFTYHPLNGKMFDISVAQMRMSTSTPQPEPDANGKWPADPEMAGKIVLESWKNKSPNALLSSLLLDGKDTTLSVDGLGAGAGAFADAKLRLECKQKGTLQSYLELSETANSKVAKLLAIDANGGKVGLEIDAGDDSYAMLKSAAGGYLAVDNEGAYLATNNRKTGLQALEDGKLDIQGESDMTLISETAIKLKSPKIQLGTGKLDHVNLIVKEGAGPPVQIMELAKWIAALKQEVAEPEDDQRDEPANQEGAHDVV